MAEVPVMKKRRTAMEEITRIDENADNGELFFRLMEELTDEEIKAHDFRHHSLRTQRRQDFHLNMYQNFTRMINKLPSTHPVEEVNKLAFPVDHNAFFKQIRFFIAFTALKTKPTGKREYIEYSTLHQYRTSIIFWATRKYPEVAGVDPPTRSKMFNKMTEQMRSTYMSRNKGHHRQQRRMPHVGLPELRQLIDYDVVTAACPENAEQHHLAYCIARQSAVRAGSLCADVTFTPDEYLRWRDIKLSCGEGAGEFQAEITINKLKTSHADPESGQHRSAVCYFDSPNAENIIFSVPHRLILMAMRRGVLADTSITTVDDIINIKQQNITFKDDRKDDPVFFAATARGLSLEERAMSVTALQAYLRKLGRALGFAEDISFHAIRRQTATDLARRIGIEATREIMSHAPDSRKSCCYCSSQSLLTPHSSQSLLTPHSSLLTITPHSLQSLLTITPYSSQSLLTPHSSQSLLTPRNYSSRPSNTMLTSLAIYRNFGAILPQCSPNYRCHCRHSGAVNRYRRSKQVQGFEECSTGIDRCRTRCR
jgi:hypothetical protein